MRFLQWGLLNTFKLRLKRLFSKRSEPALVWGPETDVEVLNKGSCPDCGSTKGFTDVGSRTIECTDCGSGYVVTPCCEPPFLAASHLGFNRKYRKVGRS